MPETPHSHLYKILVVFNDLSVITAQDIEDLHSFCYKMQELHKGKIKDILYRRNDYNFPHLYIGE